MASRAPGQRLDERVVAEGLAETRSKAQALILSGVVLVDDRRVDKAGARVRDDAAVRLKSGAAPSRYVSRGGDKLAGALAELGIDPTGQHCLDVGASTGGFTDCLLQAGALSVVALDVGRGQLHERLRQDARVTSLEQTNAKALNAAMLPRPVTLVVIDVSFISLRAVLPPVANVAPEARVIAMVKPQFEVGREAVGKGGVVRDDAQRHGAADEVAAAARALGYREVARAESRVAGPKGNREIFLCLEPGVLDARSDSGA